MNKRQLEKLFELTSDLELIKRIADEDVYTINFIIEFMSLHRDLNSKELFYYIDKFTNSIYDELRDVSKNILLNPNYSKEDLKLVFDEVYKIEDLLKYDPRIELLRKQPILENLSSLELLKLLNSDINQLSDKTYLINMMCKNPEIEKDEAFHEEINKIIQNVKKTEKEMPKTKTIYQDSSNEKRNEYLKESIIKKIGASSGKNFTKIFDLKKNLDNVTTFERLWSIDHIIKLYEEKKSNLNFDQIELLIKLNAVLDTLSSSKLNSYFEDLELTNYRTFEEILLIAYKILPYKFYDNSLDAEQLLIHQSIVSKRTNEQAMYFVDEIDKYIQEKHSYKGLKALYDIALNVSVDFEKQKNQFDYVKSLDNELDKECAAKIFLTSGYLDSDYLKKINYIDEVVKCDTPSKKKELTDAFRIIFENDKLITDERRVIIKLIRDAKTKTETKAISEIVKNSKHLKLIDIFPLIKLYEQSNITSVMDAQRNIKFINKINSATSKEEMLDVFNIVPESKSNGYFHF